MTAYWTIMEPNREIVCPVRNRETFRFQWAGTGAVGAAVGSLMYTVYT